MAVASASGLPLHGVCTLAGSGKTMKIGMEASIQGARVELQRMDVLAKLGRMT